MEQIVPGSIVEVGKQKRIQAVVCTIRPRRIEVVYLDSSHKALHQEIEWRRGGWEFIACAQDGRPADNDARLEQFVKILRTSQ